MTLLCGFLVVLNPFSQNPVTSAMFLVLTIITLAGLFVLLHAYFLAAVQVLVYAGAVMVLFLFVIMLVNIERSEREKQFNQQWIAGVAAALALGGLFVAIYVKGQSLFSAPMKPPLEAQNTQKVGEMLYSAYMFPFEIASLLLLVAIIGAVVMAKKRI